MPDDPIDLDAARRRRERKSAERAYHDGEAFGFREWDYDDDGSVGFIDDNPARPVVLMTAPPLDGICMSREDARRLGQALLDAAGSENGPWAATGERG